MKDPNAQDITMEAARMGLHTLRQQRDELDRKIRVLEKALGTVHRAIGYTTASTKMVTPVTGVRKQQRRVRPPNNGLTKYPTLPLTAKTLRRTLFSSLDNRPYTRKYVVEVLLNNNGRLMTAAELAKATGKNEGMILYCVRNSPRGLFVVERRGKTSFVGLTQTGAEIAGNLIQSVRAENTAPITSRLPKTV